MTRWWKGLLLINTLAVSIALVLSPILFNHIQDLREERVTEDAMTDVALCQSNNQQNQILAGLIRGVTKDGTGDTPEEARRQARAFQIALEQLRPVDCSALPSQRPFQQ